MPQRILVKDGDGSWKEPSVSAYRNEKELQALVASAPELLTGDPLATVAEFALPGTGYVDIVGLGADGSITVAECKLNVNAEIRRTVVGQLFAYAAAMSHLTWDDFAIEWQTKSGAAPFDDVVARLQSEVDADDLRVAVEQNLRRGAFKLVFVVDDITPELKQVIEYTNSVTRDDVSVLGVELQLAKEGSTQILVPRLWGESVVEQKRSRASAGRHWTRETFDERVGELDTDQRDVVTTLMNYGRSSGGRPYWGEGSSPGMAWYFDVSGTELSLFQVFLRQSGPEVAIHFSGLARTAAIGQSVAVGLLNRLKAINEIAPYLAAVTPTNLRRVPRIPVEGVLDKPGVVSKFTAAVDEIRASTPTASQGM